MFSEDPGDMMGDEHNAKLRALIEKNARMNEEEQSFLQSFENEWEAEYERFQRAVHKAERKLQQQHKRQVETLSELMEDAFTLAPRYSNELLAMRWTQRTLYHSNKLQEAHLLGEEADDMERAEVEECLMRTERDNLARMGALYQRHMSELEDLSKMCAGNESSLLRTHLALTENMVGTGTDGKIELSKVKAAQKEQKEAVREAEAAVQSHLQAAIKATTASINATCSAMRAHLERMAAKSMELPKDETGAVDWMNMAEPTEVFATGVDRGGRARSILSEGRRIDSTVSKMSAFSGSLPTIVEGNEAGRRNRGGGKGLRKVASAGPGGRPPRHQGGGSDTSSSHGGSDAAGAGDWRRESSEELVRKKSASAAARRSGGRPGSSQGKAGGSDAGSSDSPYAQRAPRAGDTRTVRAADRDVMIPGAHLPPPPPQYRPSSALLGADDGGGRQRNRGGAKARPSTAEGGAGPRRSAWGVGGGLPPASQGAAGDADDDADNNNRPASRADRPGSGRVRFWPKPKKQRPKFGASGPPAWYDAYTSGRQKELPARPVVKFPAPARAGASAAAASGGISGAGARPSRRRSRMAITPDPGDFKRVGEDIGPGGGGEEGTADAAEDVDGSRGDGDDAGNQSGPEGEGSLEQLD